MILSPFPLLTLAWNNYMFSMFSHCVYMLLHRYAAYEGSILWIEKIYMLKSLPIVGLISICNIFVLCFCPYSYTWCKYLLLLFPYLISLVWPNPSALSNFFICMSSKLILYMDVILMFCFNISRLSSCFRNIFNATFISL